LEDWANNYVRKTRQKSIGTNILQTHQSSSDPIQNLRKNNIEMTDTYLSSKQCNPCTSIRLPAKAWYYTTGAPNNP
jgi:hypothetical protein